MNKKPVIVLIEDEEDWLNDLSEIITLYLKNVELQAFISFEKAKKRLMEVPCNIDLLITDIYPSKTSRDTIGLKFADFAYYINKVPVIVVTGQSDFERNDNYIKVFDKGRFEIMEFVICVKKALESKKTPDDPTSIEIKTGEGKNLVKKVKKSPNLGAKVNSFTSQSRQLSAIMFTDIEGFTAIMQQNEEIAIAIKDRHRLIMKAEHRNFSGKIIQYYGDGALSIFGSVVQAVRCAIDMQKHFCELPHVPLRIGLHIGDIVIAGKDIIGDGVNIASRIESLGVSGSILISDKVNDELSNHPEFKTVSMGTYQFKNVKREIEVFAIDHEALIIPIPNTLKGKTSEK